MIKSLNCNIWESTNIIHIMTAKNKLVKAKGKARGVAKLDLPRGLTAQSFVRFRDNGVIIAPALVDQGLSFAFALNQIPDFTEFTSLYDAYIIDRVEMTFVLDANAAEKYPTLLFAPDYDDASVMASENEVLTRQDCKIMAFSADRREITMSVTPRVAMTAFRTGITSAYGWSSSGQLLDIAVTDTPWYGMRVWFVNYNTADTPGAKIRTYIKYHIRMVNQR